MKKIVFLIQNRIYDFLGRFALSLMIKIHGPRRTTSGNLSIYTILCHRDVLIHIFSIISFDYHSGTCHPLTIVDDGTLSEADKVLLKTFLDAKIVTTQLVFKKLRTLSFLSEKESVSVRNVLKTNIYCLKVLLPFLEPETPYCFLDSDTLFLRPPQRVLYWMKQKQRMVLTTDFTNVFKQKSYDDAGSDLSLRILISKFFQLRQNPFFIDSFLLLPGKRTFYNLKKIMSSIAFFSHINLTTYKHLGEIVTMVVCDGRIEYLNPITYKNLVWYPTFKMYQTNQDCFVHCTAYLKRTLLLKIILKECLRYKFFPTDSQ